MAQSRGFLGKQHADKSREKIKSTQLLNRLQSYALGEDDVDISSGQLRAIEILLKKTVPDLSQLTLEGDLGIGVREIKIEDAG